jgi:hypothetical protein
MAVGSGSYGETSLQVEQKLRAPEVRAEDKGEDKALRQSATRVVDVGCDPSTVTDLLVRFRLRLLVATLVRRTNLRKYRSTGWKVVSNQQMVSIQPVQTSQCSLPLHQHNLHCLRLLSRWRVPASPPSRPLPKSMGLTLTMTYTQPKCTKRINGLYMHGGRALMYKVYIVQSSRLEK